MKLKEFPHSAINALESDYEFELRLKQKRELVNRQKNLKLTPKQKFINNCLKLQSGELIFAD